MSDARKQFSPFSVLMAVYGGDNAFAVSEALRSNTIAQTLPPAQVVIVRDGSVDPLLQWVLDTASTLVNQEEVAQQASRDSSVSRHHIEVTVIELPQCGGLAAALNAGLPHCRYELVARADSDDISVPERFAWQINTFAHATQQLDVVGGFIQEFHEVPESREKTESMTEGREDFAAASDAFTFAQQRIQRYFCKVSQGATVKSEVTSAVTPTVKDALQACAPKGMNEQGHAHIALGEVRRLPQGGEVLASWARLRSPLHHPSVMLRKSSIVSAGGYPEDAGRFEDYLLWERLLMRHAVMVNVPRVLVWYRVGTQAFARRGGWTLMRAEVHLQCQFWRDGFISTPLLVRNIAVRMLYRLIPARLKQRCYHFASRMLRRR